MYKYCNTKNTNKYKKEYNCAQQKKLSQQQILVTHTMHTMDVQCLYSLMQNMKGTSLTVNQSKKQVVLFKNPSIGYCTAQLNTRSQQII